MNATAAVSGHLTLSQPRFEIYAEYDDLLRLKLSMLSTEEKVTYEFNLAELEMTGSSPLSVHGNDPKFPRSFEPIQICSGLDDKTAKR
ncbi:MAG: hypothetical protein HC902_04435 [Calothrix sp. SM1_5_4]|nr:hypothetical protein [Calothrix sp. SM1_5_4]